MVARCEEGDFHVKWSCYYVIYCQVDFDLSVELETGKNELTDGLSVEDARRGEPRWGRAYLFVLGTAAHSWDALLTRKASNEVVLALAQLRRNSATL